MIYIHKKKLYFILIEKLLLKGFIMKKLLTWSCVVLCMLYPAFSFSMDDEENAVTICGFSPETLSKTAYICSFVTGVTCLSAVAYVKISTIAREHHHVDPTSEGYAAFLGTQAIGAAVAAVGYNYCFDRQSSPTPMKMVKTGPSNTFLKHQSQTPYEKTCRKQIKKANSKRDNRKKLHNKVKRD